MNSEQLADLKACFKCGRSLPRSEFYAYAAMADGLLGKCKDCVRRDGANLRAQKIEYRTWQSMISRCTDPKHPAFALYGGRGITVCERWLDYAAFIADMGHRPSPFHSIDRYPNNDGNYEPGNVRWATVAEQARNRRTNRWIEYNGRRMILRDWALEVGIYPSTLRRRIDSGWSIEDALMRPTGD